MEKHLSIGFYLFPLSVSKNIADDGLITEKFKGVINCNLCETIFQHNPVYSEYLFSLN